MAQKEPERGRFIAVPEGEVLGEDELFHVSDEEKAFSDFRNSLNAGEEMATVRVSKIPKSGITGHPTNAKSVYCFAFPVDRFTFEELCEFLRENYGGGLYRLIGTKKGHRGAAFNQLLEIAEAIAPRKSSDNFSSPPNLGAIIESVSSLILQSQEKTEALLNRVGLGAAPPADPFAHFERMVTIFSQMGLFARAAPSGGDFLGELEKLAKIRELLGSMTDGDGGGNSESNFYDLASAGVKAITPILTAVAARGGLGAQPALPAPAPGPVAKPASAPNGMDAPKPEPTDVNLKTQVDILVLNARAGLAPESLAAMILNATPDDKLNELHAFISSGDVLERMAKVNPAVTELRPFFEKLRDTLLAELVASETDAEPPPPTV